MATRRTGSGVQLASRTGSSTDSNMDGYFAWYRRSRIVVQSCCYRLTGERDSPAAGDRRCGSSRKIGCSQMAANREVLCDLKVTAQLRWNQDLSKDRVDKVMEPGDPGLGSWINHGWPLIEGR
jgi:hypothetical protein